MTTSTPPGCGLAIGPTAANTRSPTPSDRMPRAMTGPPRFPNQPPAPAPDEPDAPHGLDLGELLASRGLAHWRGLLDELFARYAGWLTDYWVDPQFDLDLWPCGDVIKVLVAMPPSPRGDDLAFARALASCDFLVRLARDQDTGQPWDALSVSYREFARQHKTVPYWGLEAPWPAEIFSSWALRQLRKD
jgi:hypothetical protein